MITHLGESRTDAAHTLLKQLEKTPQGSELSMFARIQLSAHLNVPPVIKCVWMSGQIMRICAEKLIDEPTRVR